MNDNDDDDDDLETWIS